MNHNITQQLYASLAESLWHVTNGTLRRALHCNQLSCIHNNIVVCEFTRHLHRLLESTSLTTKEITHLIQL